MTWALKILAKLIMARLPVDYKTWRQIGIFRHGQMDACCYSSRVFQLHFNRAFPENIPKGAVFLEMGPGDSIASAVLAAGLGGSRTYLVDVGDFASRDVAVYKSLADEIRAQGGQAPNLSDAQSFEDVLKICNVVYATHGLSSFRDIPTGCIDFAWSHSVLEHVRKHEFAETLGELKRVLKPNAIASHNIDFQDHIAHALNNLRFSEGIWESDFFVHSNFYTNRIPAVRMHAMFRDAGFRVLEEDFGRWPSMPTARRALHRDFLAYRDDELLIRTSSVLLQA